MSSTLAQQPLSPFTEAPTASSTNEPRTVTATFGDWTLRCDNTGERSVCRVTQTIAVAGRGTIAQLEFVKPTAENGMIVTALLPPNISISAGVRLGVDAKDPNATILTWRKCLTGGCVADAQAPNETIRLWRAQTGAGQIAYAAASGQTVTVGISFKGFAQVIDEYLKTASHQ